MNNKRKTPCQDCKPRIKDSTYFWCNGCGEWEVVNGKAVRPAVPYLTTTMNQGGSR